MQRLAQAINDTARRVPRWPLYPIGLIPAAFWLYALLSGGLGPDPVKTVEQNLGLTGLKFLIAVLTISPLRRHFGISLIKYRRALGLLAFYYILMHLLTWVALDFEFHWGEMLKGIVKRPFITIGM